MVHKTKTVRNSYVCLVHLSPTLGFVFYQKIYICTFRGGDNVRIFCFENASADFTIITQQ